MNEIRQGQLGIFNSFTQNLLCTSPTHSLPVLTCIAKRVLETWGLGMASQFLGCLGELGEGRAGGGRVAVEWDWKG